MRNKFLALALSLALIMSLCPTAWAANDDYKTWRQGDSSWGTLSISGTAAAGATDSSNSMLKYGCYITAVTKLLIHSGQQDASFTPNQCLEALKKYNLLSSSGDLSFWKNTDNTKKFLNEYAPQLKYEKTDVGKTLNREEAIQEIGSYINDGYYVIIRVKSGEDGYHFIAVDHVESGKNGNVYVMDNGGVWGVYGNNEGSQYGKKTYQSGINDITRFKYTGSKSYPAGPKSSKTILELVKGLLGIGDSNGSKEPAASSSTTAPAPFNALTISPATKPGQNMKQGDPFYFKGKITSNYLITSATVSILSADGNSIQSKTITPNSKSVDIATSGLDSLKFGKLEPGSYVLCLTAADDHPSSQTWKQEFSIKGTPTPTPTPNPTPAPAISSLAISPTTKPGQNMKQGDPFYFKGKITSNYLITSATVSILSADGNSIQSKTISPNSKSVDIATSGLDSLKFGKLEPGSYVFRLTATDNYPNSQTWKQAFSIKGTPTPTPTPMPTPKPTPSSSPAPASTPAPAPSSLTISPSTKPEQGLEQGKPFYFKGKITSNYKITSATVSILSADGSSTLQTKTITPNTTSVDIATSGLDSLKFGKLNAGSYLFRLSAKDASGNAKTWEQAFSIQGVVSTLAISPTTKPGQNLPKGKPFYFKGKITSNYNITSATVSILSADGSSTLQTRTITPNATSVDIATSGLDSLKFGNLNTGSYLFKLTATDASGNKKVWQQPFSIR